MRSPLRTSKLQVPRVLLSSSSWCKRRWSRPGWRLWAGSWWFPRLSCHGRRNTHWFQCHCTCHTLARSHGGRRTKLPRVLSISSWFLQSSLHITKIHTFFWLTLHYHTRPMLYPWEMSSPIWGVVWSPNCSPQNYQLIHAALPSGANRESVRERKVLYRLK